MSAILLPRKFTRQPQYPAPLAGGPLRDRARFVLLGNQSSEILNGINRSGTIGTTEATTDGIAYLPTTANTVWTKQVNDLDPYVAGSFSVNWYGILRADTFQNLLNYTGPYGWEFRTYNWGANQIRLGLTAYWSGASPATGAIGAVDNILHSVAMVYDDAAASVEFFLDGRSAGSVGYSKDPGAIGAGSFSVKGHSTLPHKMLTVQAYKGKLTPAEILTLAQNPWQIFKAPSRKLWFEPPAPVGTSGSVNYTNIDDSSAAAATPTVTASSATTNANDASSASATPVVTASSATTNADDVSNASAAVGSEVTATVAVTNADDTSAATASPVISASSGTTNTDDVSSGTAAATVTGSAANTNADDISAASAAAGSEVAGSVAYTNIDDVSSATAIPAITAQAASINADDSSSATLTATVTASVAVANSNDVSAAYSGAVVEGSIAVTNADDVSAATASPVVSLSSATTNADDVSSAEAVAEAGEIIASVDVTNADDVSGAVAAPLIVGSVAYSNLHDLSAAIAEINFGTIVEAALTSGLVQESRVKKPGIPSDAPEWQRTMFEIFTGRRGNKIDVAKFQSLTFSATPTQAECEALYSYINEVRQSIDQLTKRFDS